MLMRYVTDSKGLVALALLAGVLSSAGFPPLEVALFTALGLMGLFWLVEATQTRRARVSFFVGFAWGMGYFSMGLAWTYHAMHNVGGLPQVLAGAGLLSLAFILALFSGSFAAFSRFFKVSPCYRVTLIYPALFTLIEFSRGEIIGQFGWLNPAYAYAGNILAAWAPLIGVYGVCFVVALLSGLIVWFLSSRQSQEGTVQNKRQFLILFFLFGVTAVGTYALNNVTWHKASQRLEVRLLQPAIRVGMRPTLQGQTENVTRAEAMSEVTPMGKSPDLIVWPEGVYVVPLQRLPKDLREAPLRVAERVQAPVLFNAFHEPRRGEFHNAMWVAREAKEGPGYEEHPIYTKRHLVPFGEFVPWGFRWFVDAMHIPMADQVKGKASVRPLCVAGVDVALGICYENLFAEEMRSWFSEDCPNLIIYSVNLSWFGSAVNRQFLLMSQMRAREAARPVLQCVNAGFSALITADGTVERLARAGGQTFDVSLRCAVGEKTPFMRWGSLPLIILLILVLIGFSTFSYVAKLKK